MTNTTTVDHPPDDTVDLLMPPPRPWGVRLTVALLLILGVGTVAVGWGYGYLRPAPDCCGSGSASAAMTLTADGEAVRVTAFFYNSSPADLVVTGGRADLPGAEVLAVHAVVDDTGSRIPSAVEALPVTVDGRQGRSLAITFRPTICDKPDPGKPWGRLTVDLERPDRWYPTLRRSFETPDWVVEPHQLQYWASPDEVSRQGDHPITAACTLLGLTG